MIPIHIIANYLPDRRKFKVQLTAQGQKWVELLSIDDFLKRAHDTTAPLVIGGMKVEVVDEVDKVTSYLRAYLLKVATSFEEWQRRLPQPKKFNADNYGKGKYDNN